MSNYQVDCQAKMEKSLQVFQEHLNSIRTSQANVKILDKVQVMYYDSLTPLNQVASLSVQDSQQIIVKPYDQSLNKEIEKALLQHLDYTINNDGEVIRIIIPPLTTDRRKEFVKEAQKYQEEAKVAIRNIRREFNDQIKKDAELSENVQKNLLTKIQEETDKYVKKIETLTKEKEKALLTI